MKLEYLVFNCIVIGGPLLLSLIPKLKLHKPKLIPSIIAITISAIIFLIWDYIVTGYFWFFNPTYILGIYIGKIPLEEVLFFISVPYSCLLIWQNITHKFKSTIIPKFPYLILSLTILAIVFSSSLLYTWIVLFVFLITIVLDYLLSTHLFTNSLFIKFLGIVILLTIIFNGYLTARRIVTYNLDIKTNLQVGTVPIEDIIYGMALISLTTILYERVSSRRKF